MAPRRLKDAKKIPEGDPAPLDRPMISHDLQSALSDVISGLELMNTAQLDKENQIHFDRAKSASETLSRLMTRLGESLQGEKSDLGTEVDAFDLNQFLNDLHRRWTSRAAAKGIKLNIEASKDLPKFVGLDRTALERIISNILENSIKFCDEGVVQLDVGVSHDDALMFVLRDNGPGFSQDAMDLLFEYKGRPETSRKPGTGIGLHIVKRLVDQMAAKIDVFNQSSGAFVSIEIPHHSWYFEKPQNKQPDSDRSLQGMRMLLAEDNPTSQMLLHKLVESFGVDLHIVDNGKDALEALETQDFDAALLDIEMPELSGLDVIMEIRKRKDYRRDIPIIAVSAYVMPGNRETILLSGADHIITKPVSDAAAFKASITTIITSKQEENERRQKLSDTSDGKMINRSSFNSLVGTVGVENIGELLSKVLIDLRNVSGELKTYTAKMDLEGIRSQTHILVSVAGAMGASRVQQMAEKLNIAANQEAINDVREIYDECASGLLKLVVEIDELMRENTGTQRE